MDYVSVGATGVQVSPLCFGTMSFGGDADEQTSGQLYRRVREAGINFFDTANVYSRGASEEILGRLMAGHRDELVITSKVGFSMGDGPNDSGLSRRHIMTSVHESLRRLGTDRLDFYFVHTFDDATAIEESVRAMDDLVRQGTILYPAVSNWAAWQIATALGIAARQVLARFELIQPMYNLVRRQAEVELLPLARAENLGVISYSPLGGGLLTGKYGPDTRPQTGRLIDHDLYTRRYSRHSDFEIAGEFTALAQRLDLKAPTLAVAWAMSNPDVTAPIIGARNLSQLDDSLAALDVRLTEEELRQVNALSPTPPPATDRTETQASAG